MVLLAISTLGFLREAPTEELLLGFPQLAHLSITKESDEHVLFPNTLIIPSHMKSLHLDVELEELPIISRLPVKPIDRMIISLGLCMVLDIEELIKTTNRLLGDTKDPGSYADFKLEGLIVRVDIEQTTWFNVMYMEIGHSGSDTLSQILSRPPLAKWIKAL